MDVTRLRFRCLAAMGMAAMPACTEASASVETTTKTATPTATTTVDIMTGASIHHSCPSGNFCVVQPATVAPDAGAPVPYGMCAATVAPPTDAGAPTYAYVTFDPDGTKTARTTDAKACCYHWSQLCVGGGRALRDSEGRALTAETLARGDWVKREADDGALTEALRAIDVQRDDRLALAERWAREAAFEHASIASFARVTLDLLAMGAPASLVGAAQRAGLDEVRHARIAYALASAYAGKALGPGPLVDDVRRPPATLESIVREAIVDGCIGETAAALTLRQEASRAASAPMRALLERMADDEERHAELAFATVAWASREGGAAISRVIEQELSRPQSDEARARAASQIAAPCLTMLV